MGFVPPLLPTLVDEVPLGEDWQHEIKHDGWRAEVAIEGGQTRVFTRNGLDYSKQFASIVAASRALECKSALIDGEVVVQDEHGRSHFDALRDAMRDHQHRLVYYAFDLLSLNGTDLRRVPLEERREELRILIGSHDPSFAIQFSEAIIGNGEAMFAAAYSMELEGIISKKRGSLYRSGRSTAWLKIKCYDESDFVVLGAEHEPGKPAFALLAREMDEGLEYVGSAFVTLGAETRERFWSEIDRLAQAKPAIGILGHKKARWIAPEMRVRSST